MGNVELDKTQINSRLLHILTRFAEFEARIERVEQWLENIEETISKEN